MTKVILVDGNNLMFRSFYATIHSGQIMKSSKGVPTNALFGFTNMINKIIDQEKPEYMCVAFDIGKNFRKQEYDFYKEGRESTPDELKIQMKLAHDILDVMGIKHVEMEPYEADDIIGTVVNMAEKDPKYESVIISSDKDLLQLISDETEVKLLKQVGNIRYNKSKFIEDYGIDPIKIIDLKALMGDKSDNIPGVRGIGEKTALKLLQEYKDLDGVYNNLDKLTPKIRQYLTEDKENAYMSKKIATIYREVPLDCNFEDFKYLGPDTDKLLKLYDELEFFFFLKRYKREEKVDTSFITINNVDELILDNFISIYLEVSDSNYHIGEILGMSITDKNNTYYIKKELINEVLPLIKNKEIITYDLKKHLVKLGKINCNFDLMIAAYLLNYNIKDDIGVLMSSMGYEVTYYDLFKKNKFENLESVCSKKSKFIFNVYEIIKERLEKEDHMYLFNKIEMPLIEVLTDMELTGFKVEDSILEKMTKDIEAKIDIVSRDIFNLTGCVFNIASPKQLGEVLFDKLELGKGIKNRSGYKTDVKTLQKLVDVHPVINKIFEYRNLTKIKGTYLDGLRSYILSDGKIHTIFNQTLTRTGRLSSMDPNLQNIPVKEELGRKVRIAFVPENDYILSSDYSQIELRLMAHISDSKELKDAFIHGEDIHRKVASDIYGVPLEDVTKNMRSTAKAVIFGIIYGISGYGLGENLNISKSEADEFIKKYYELYPGVKKYMDYTIRTTKETGYVKTLFGRVRKIDEIKNSNFMVRQMGERMALNTPIQGTSADIMKLAMINVYNKFKELNIQSKMILQVHDEILVDTKKEELELVSKIVKEEMENVYKLSVPLKAEVDYGINWYEAK